MANVKKIWTAKIATAATVYAIVRREADLYRLDDADGLTFASAPADPYLSLAEDAVIKGLYEVSENRAAWDPGAYKAFIYTQAGASPAPASDTLADTMDFWISGDRICVDFPFEQGVVATDASNAANAFKTDLLSTTNDYCKDSFLKFVSGALVNQTRRILSYNGTSKVLTVTSAFTGIPADGVEFFIVNQ